MAVAWLANCTPDDDALTEMSRLSLGRSAPSSAGDDPVSARAAAILHDLDQVRRLNRPDRADALWRQACSGDAPGSARPPVLGQGFAKLRGYFWSCQVHYQ